MARRLNVGAGGNVEIGEWTNIDKNPTHPDVRRYDVDANTPPLAYWHDNELDEVRVWGCLNEFNTSVVTMMSEFYRILKNGGILDIFVAVVDNNLGPYRDPIARRYLSSEWVNYFAGNDGGRLEGGRGLGFTGQFEIVSNEVGGERHHVVLKAIKE